MYFLNGKESLLQEIPFIATKRLKTCNYGEKIRKSGPSIFVINPLLLLLLMIFGLWISCTIV
jgi:hypothetical protein